MSNKYDQKTTDEEVEDEDTWEEVEIVSGKLVRVSKADHEVTIEVEDMEGGELVIRPTTYYLPEDMDKSQLEELRNLIGTNIDAQIEDRTLVAAWRNYRD